MQAEEGEMWLEKEGKEEGGSHHLPSWTTHTASRTRLTQKRGRALTAFSDRALTLKSLLSWERVNDVDEGKRPEERSCTAC